MEPLLLAEPPVDAAPALAVYAPQRSEWRGELELWFDVHAARTRLHRRRHLGPLMVQRPFHPEPDGTCHVYLLHPPGGVAGGDSLEMTFHLAPGARALLTTPGATKFYRSRHGASRQTARIHVGAGAVCEYLPQETIVYDGADASLATQVELADGATYVGWDFISLGRPAAGERFAAGALRQRVEVVRGGRPVWFERLALAGGSSLADAAFALAGKPILGTMVHVGPADEGAAERLRRELGEDGRGVLSVSQLEEAIVCRYLGASMSEGKALFVRAWAVLRGTCQGKPSAPPRIWAT